MGDLSLGGSVLKIKGNEVLMMTEDERPKPKTTLVNLAKLPTVFKKNGTVTDGSPSGICDGAGRVIVSSESVVKFNNLKPLVARVVGYVCHCGLEPSIMGIGPVSTIQKLLKVTGIQLKDIDPIEINEAFGAQTLACQKEVGIDIEKLNVSGGAIAFGHPLAGSGSRITSHLVHELKRRGVQYGIGSACIDGGQGITVLIESL